MNGDCRISDGFGDLEISAGCIFQVPNRGHIWEKEDVWSPYINLYINSGGQYKSIHKQYQEGRGNKLAGGKKTYFSSEQW